MGKYSNKLELLCKLALGMLMLGVICAFIYDGYISLYRLPPLSLNISEEVTAIAAKRLHEGKDIYTSLEQSGGYYFYSPLLPLLASFLIPLTGSPVLALNITCIIFTGLTAVLLFLFAKSLSKSITFGLLATVIFICCYEGYSEWLFISLADNVALPLTIAGLYVQYICKGKKNILLRGIPPILIMSAALAKSNYGIFGISWFIIECCTVGVLRALLASIGSLALFAGFAYKFNTGAEHWFEHILALGNRHYEPIRKLHWLSYKLTKPFIMLLIWGVFGIFSLKTSRQQLAAGMILLFALISGGIAFVRIGGSMNAFYPAYALLAILCALFLCGIWKLCTRARDAKYRIMPLIMLCTIFIFCFREYAKGVQRKADNRNNAAAIIEFVTQIQKDLPPGAKIYIPQHPVLMYHLGQEDYVTMSMINEKCLLSGKPLPLEFQNNIRNQLFERIVMWDEAYKTLPQYSEFVEKYYTFSRPLTITGKDKSMSYRIYQRKNEPAQ